MNTIFTSISARLQRGEKFALATIVEHAGSAPRERGAKMLIMADGSIEGTIGGGQLEYQIIQDAKRCMMHGKSELISYNLSKDLNMRCGGQVSVFIDPLIPLPRVIIFGAGHVGTALVNTLLPLPFHICIVDDREEWANRERLPDANEVLCLPFDEVVGTMEFFPTDSLIIMTRGHDHDYLLLKNLITKPWSYLGMIGSRRKVSKSLELLQNEGIDPELIARVHAPIGLNIGADSPAEIAISIAAELIMHHRYPEVSDDDLGRPMNSQGKGKSA